MRRIGIVKNVFVPVDEELTKIGFEIEVEEEKIIIVEEQTKENAKIYREDKVVVVETLKEEEKEYKIYLVKEEGEEKDG